VIAAEVLLPDVRLLGSSNTEGRFRIANVPVGPQRVQVRRLGYRSLELTVVVSGSMPSPLEIRMEPDPVQLEGLRVAPNARGAVAGVVVDASSGAPVPWAYLTLTRGVTERVGRPLTAEENGTFGIRNVTAGEYMLKVERLGYFPQFLAFAHTVPADTLVVRLEPDLEVMQGLVEFRKELAFRKNSFAGTSFSFGEERMLSSEYRMLCDFERFDIKHSARIVVNDLPADARCEGHLTAEVAHINVFECRRRPTTYTEALTPLSIPPPPSRRGTGVYRLPPPTRPSVTLIFIYTVDYMEQMARRPRAAIPLLC
jgi:hypothetical protein